MRTEKVTCDGCGHDLTTRSNIEDYRLVLASESKPGYGAGAYTCMAIRPPIERTHHFCTLRCLDHWRDRERYRAKLWREWNEKWKDEHGTKDASGQVTSWTSPPDDVRAERAAQFEATALEKFPVTRLPRD